MKMSRRGILISAPAGAVLAVAPAVTRSQGLIRMEAGTFHAGALSERSYIDYRGCVGIRKVHQDGTATFWMYYAPETLTATDHVEVCTWSVNGMRAISEVPVDRSVIREVVRQKQLKPQERERLWFGWHRDPII